MPSTPDAAAILGQRIADARRAFGVSQQVLGECADMHFTNVGKIERGETNPNLHSIVRIAAALGMDPGDLIHGIDAASVPDGDRVSTLEQWVAARGDASRRRRRSRAVD